MLLLPMCSHTFRKTRQHPESYVPVMSIGGTGSYWQLASNRFARGKERKGKEDTLTSTESVRWNSTGAMPGTTNASTRASRDRNVHKAGSEEDHMLLLLLLAALDSYVTAAQRSCLSDELANHSLILKLMLQRSRKLIRGKIDKIIYCILQNFKQLMNMVEL